MDTKSLKIGHQRNQGVKFSDSAIKLDLFTQEISVKREDVFVRRGLFASVNQVGKGFGIPPNSVENAMKISSSTMSMQFVSNPEPVEQAAVVIMELGEVKKKNKEKGGFEWRIRVGNQALRRLISGGIAGAVSRTFVAPLETIRTHLMIGSCGNSSMEVFDSIMKSDGWPGLFRGNFVNVIRVAPSKAIEVCFCFFCLWFSIDFFPFFAINLDCLAVLIEI